MKDWLENDRSHRYLTTEQFRMLIYYQCELNHPEDIEAFINLLQHIDIQAEYTESMQSIAQQLRSEVDGTRHRYR